MGKLDCRILLIVINSKFKSVGLWFLGLGVGLKYGKNTKPIYELNNDPVFTGGVKIILALGSVLLIVGAIGNYGAGRMRLCPLRWFSFFVTILIVAEVVIGVVVQYSGKEIHEFYQILYEVKMNTTDQISALTLGTIDKMLYCCELNPDSHDTCSEDYIKPSCPMFAGRNLAILIGTEVVLIAAQVCSFSLQYRIQKSQPRSVQAPQVQQEAVHGITDNEMRAITTLLFNGHRG